MSNVDPRVRCSLRALDQRPNLPRLLPRMDLGPRELSGGDNCKGGFLIVVVIATVGRPRHVEDSLSLLSRQSRLPDLVLVSATAARDLPQEGEAFLQKLPFEARLLIGPKGLTRQRNRALAALDSSRALDAHDDIVVFFDDDFVPREDWLENAAAEFAARESCVGLTGVLLADGANGAGYELAQAKDMLKRGSGLLGRHDRRVRAGPTRALYGCNMAMRAKALRAIKFDEELPLYGWLEDEDVSGQLRRAGELIRSDRLVGIHLGTKSGRVSGTNYGYSQVANPIYLARKGTYSPPHALALMSRNLAANILKSAWPEPYVDRASRLRGNMLAFADLARGRLHPSRAATLH